MKLRVKEKPEDIGMVTIEDDDEGDIAININGTLVSFFQQDRKKLRVNYRTLKSFDYEVEVYNQG